MTHSLVSLVGMTMGARKRAARRDAVTAEESGIYTDKGAELRRHMLAVFVANVVDDEETKRRYAEARARYRIGERLRPCPGCHDCQPDPRQRHKSWVNLPVWCDGSGVLPARSDRSRKMGH